MTVSTRRSAVAMIADRTAYYVLQAYSYEVQTVVSK